MKKSNQSIHSLSKALQFAFDDNNHSVRSKVLQKRATAAASQLLTMMILLIKLLLLRLRPRFREMKTFTLVEHREGPEEIAGAAALVGVADELRVELLVPLQRDAALLLVILLQAHGDGRRHYGYYESCGVVATPFCTATALVMSPFSFLCRVTS